jgi:hypothetical protein
MEHETDTAPSPPQKAAKEVASSADATCTPVPVSTKAAICVEGGTVVVPAVADEDMGVVQLPSRIGAVVNVPVVDSPTVATIPLASSIVDVPKRVVECGRGSFRNGQVVMTVDAGSGIVRANGAFSCAVTFELLDAAAGEPAQKDSSTAVRGLFDLAGGAATEAEELDKSSPREEVVKGLTSNVLGVMLAGLTDDLITRHVLGTSVADTHTVSSVLENPIVTLVVDMEGGSHGSSSSDVADSLVVRCFTHLKEWLHSAVAAAEAVPATSLKLPSMFTVVALGAMRPIRIVLAPRPVPPASLRQLVEATARQVISVTDPAILPRVRRATILSALAAVQFPSSEFGSTPTHLVNRDDILGALSEGKCTVVASAEVAAAGERLRTSIEQLYSLTYTRATAPVPLLCPAAGAPCFFVDVVLSASPGSGNGKTVMNSLKTVANKWNAWMILKPLPVTFPAPWYATQFGFLYAHHASKTVPDAVYSPRVHKLENMLMCAPPPVTTVSPAADKYGVSGTGTDGRRVSVFTTAMLVGPTIPPQSGRRSNVYELQRQLWLQPLLRYRLENNPSFLLRQTTGEADAVEDMERTASRMTTAVGGSSSSAVATPTSGSGTVVRQKKRPRLHDGKQTPVLGFRGMPLTVTRPVAVVPRTIAPPSSQTSLAIAAEEVPDIVAMTRAALAVARRDEAIVRRAKIAATVMDAYDAPYQLQLKKWLEPGFVRVPSTRLEEVLEQLLKETED